MTEHADNRQTTLEQPIKPTDNVQTKHTMEVLADGGPLEPKAERPDLIDLTEEQVANLPTNIVK